MRPGRWLLLQGLRPDIFAIWLVRIPRLHPRHNPEFQSSGPQYARDEYDLDAQWSLPSGKLNGLMFRFRYAYITQTNDTRLTDFRLMLYYTPPSK